MSVMMEPNPHPGLFASVLPQTQRLPRNPMLPQHPLGAYTDAQYEAQAASLRAQVSRAYADVLKRLGFISDTGDFVPGELETQAFKQRGELSRGSELAAEEETNRSQQLGTLFSGIRGLRQARAQHPFVSALADLDVQTPLGLSELYENASGLVSDYTLQQNQLLADAAARRAAALTQNPTGAVGAGPDGGVTPLVPPPVSGEASAAGYPYVTGLAPGEATTQVAALPPSAPIPNYLQPATDKVGSAAPIGADPRTLLGVTAAARRRLSGSGSDQFQAM